MRHTEVAQQHLPSPHASHLPISSMMYRAHLPSRLWIAPDPSSVNDNGQRRLTSKRKHDNYYLTGITIQTSQRYKSQTARISTLRHYYTLLTTSTTPPITAASSPCVLHPSSAPHAHHQCPTLDPRRPPPFACASHDQLPHHAHSIPRLYFQTPTRTGVFSVSAPSEHSPVARRHAEFDLAIALGRRGAA